MFNKEDYAAGIREGLRRAADLAREHGLRRFAQKLDKRANRFCLFCPGTEGHMFSCSYGGARVVSLPAQQVDDGYQVSVPGKKEE